MALATPRSWVRFPGKARADKNVKTVTWMQCKSLWIQASAKCINVYRLSLALAISETWSERKIWVFKSIIGAQTLTPEVFRWSACVRQHAEGWLSSARFMSPPISPDDSSAVCRFTCRESVTSTHTHSVRATGSSLGSSSSRVSAPDRCETLRLGLCCSERETHPGALWEFQRH